MSIAGTVDIPSYGSFMILFYPIVESTSHGDMNMATWTADDDDDDDDDDDLVGDDLIDDDLIGDDLIDDGFSAETFWLRNHIDGCCHYCFSHATLW